MVLIPSFLFTASAFIISNCRKCLVMKLSEIFSCHDYNMPSSNLLVHEVTDHKCYREHLT